MLAMTAVMQVPILSPKTMKNAARKSKSPAEASAMTMPIVVLLLIGALAMLAFPNLLSPAIEKKTVRGEQLTKDDLAFLYELDAPIEGFGYQKDPRIEELREERDPEEDMPVVFECTKDRIAHNIDIIPLLIYIFNLLLIIIHDYILFHFEGGGHHFIFNGELRYNDDFF